MKGNGTSGSKPRSTARQGRGRSVKGRKQGHRKGNKGKSMSAAMRNTIAVAIVLLFAAGFYFLVISPNLYRWKRCSGYKNYGVCIPCAYNVHGIDISHYQGVIDWPLLRTNQKDPNSPIQFIFLKATEGGDYIDSTFSSNFARARASGFIRGAYHYFIPTTDARKQAQFFISQVQLQPGDLPPVLDVETVGRKSSGTDIKTSVKTWLDIVEAYYGVTPILYTSHKFRERYLSDAMFDKYPYWIAHYYVDSVRYAGHWEFWQHTDAGRVDGIRGLVDLNVFNGPLSELMELTLRGDSVAGAVVQ